MKLPFLILSVAIVLSGCRQSPAPSQDAELQELKRQVQQLKEGASAESKPSASQPRLSGAVYYRFGSGESTIVRANPVFILTQQEAGSDHAKLTKANATDNLDIYLMTETIGLDTRWPINRLMNDRGASFFRELDGVFDKIRNYASKASVKVTTNADGKYSVPDLPSGKYHVVSFLETDQAKGFWYVPVDLAQPGPVVLDLNNSNIKVFDSTAPLK